MNADQLSALQANGDFTELLPQWVAVGVVLHCF